VTAQVRPAFTMVGAADASACEGDNCVVPAAAAAPAPALSPLDIEPGADEAAAASGRAVTAALDEGASL